MTLPRLLITLIAVPNLLLVVSVPERKGMPNLFLPLFQSDALQSVDAVCLNDMYNEDMRCIVLCIDLVTRTTFHERRTPFGLNKILHCSVPAPNWIGYIYKVLVFRCFHLLSFPSLRSTLLASIHCSFSTNNGVSSNYLSKYLEQDETEAPNHSTLEIIFTVSSISYP